MEHGLVFRNFHVVNHTESLKLMECDFTFMTVHVLKNMYRLAW